jgi:ABC-type nickel/cobalt efflux system permease component RcnA
MTLSRLLIRGFALLLFAFCVQLVLTAAGEAQERMELASAAQAQPASPPKSAFGTAPALQPQGGAQPQAGTDERSFFQRAWVWVLQQQQQLHRDLAKAVRELRSNPWTAGWTLIALSFFYGIVHAVGPGHGKAIITSYVLANRQTIRRGVFISFAAALVQALSAITLVLVMALIFRAAGSQMQSAVTHLETISYAMVTLLGAYLLAGQIRKLLRNRGGSAMPVRAVSLSAAAVHNAHNHVKHEHDADCGCGHAHMPDAADLQGALSWRRTLAIVLSVGIRPCTGAVLVLVFALTQGLLWAGIISAFVMALGTAITVSAMTVFATGLRDAAASLGGSKGVWLERFYNAIAFAGAMAIFVFGAAFFVNSLGPAKPF